MRRVDDHLFPEQGHVGVSCTYAVSRGRGRSRAARNLRPGSASAPVAACVVIPGRRHGPPVPHAILRVARREARRHLPRPGSATAPPALRPSRGCTSPWWEGKSICSTTASGRLPATGRASPSRSVRVNTLPRLSAARPGTTTASTTRTGAAGATASRPAAEAEVPETRALPHATAVGQRRRRPRRAGQTGAACFADAASGERRPFSVRGSGAGRAPVRGPATSCSPNTTSTGKSDTGPGCGRRTGRMAATTLPGTAARQELF